MRWLRYIRASLLALTVTALMMSQTAFAADEEYTYTVRLFAGNLGELTGDQVGFCECGCSEGSGGDHRA